MDDLPDKLLLYQEYFLISFKILNKLVNGKTSMLDILPYFKTMIMKN